MKKSKAIILLLRLPFLSVTLGAVFLGTAFAWWQTTQFNFFYFILVFFGACFLHIACNVANDYYDFKSGNDASNQNALVPFSGGSRMILDGFIKPGEALFISLIFVFAGSIIGLFLNVSREGNVILLIGLAAVFFTYSYNGFPVKLVKIGLGELAIFLAWGPLMVIGAYYVQAASLSSIWPIIISIPSGILTSLVLLINEFADKESDEFNGRKTWVILFGYRKSLFLYLFLSMCCYTIVLFGAFFGNWPILSLLVVLTIPMPIIAFKVGIRNLENWHGFLPAVKTTILMNFVFLVILSISFLV